MIRDANEAIDGTRFEADLCIVGAGAAGISLALELIGSGLQVLIIESGGLEEEPTTHELFTGEVVDEHLHSPADRYRQRRLGGTTTIWGGRCMPFDPIDFEKRGYAPLSGWPIGLDSLLPFYGRANQLCEAGDFDYIAESALGPRDRPIIEGFEPVNFSSNRLERFSCPTDFGARYRHKLEAAANIRVLLHANLTKIELDGDGQRVEQLGVKTLSGKSFSVHAVRFVLATGGLETARILLANQHQRAAGLGNEHDMVGRHYMCHLAGTIGAIQIRRPTKSVHHGYLIADDGVYCRRRFALHEDVQRAEHLGNFVVRLHHPRITDPRHRNGVLSLLFLAKPFIPYEYAKRLHGEGESSSGDVFKHLANVATGPFEAAGFAWHMLRDRKLAERKFPSIIIKSKANLYSLDFHAEQFPNPASRVSLADSVDPLGMRRIKIDWRYLPEDVHTVKRALELLTGDFAKGGVGQLEYDAESVEHEMTRYGAYGGHHIGTARMGSDPSSSVVDTNCRLHSVTNLYLAGSSVFPTSSQANPTLTIVALALRLAEHLRRTT